MQCSQELSNADELSQTYFFNPRSFCVSLSQRYIAQGAIPKRKPSKSTTTNNNGSSSAGVKETPSKKSSNGIMKPDLASNSSTLSQRPNSPPVRSLSPSCSKKDGVDKLKPSKKNSFDSNEGFGKNEIERYDVHSMLETAAGSTTSTTITSNEKTEVNGKLSEAEAQTMLQRIASTKGGCKRKSIIEFLEAANHFGAFLRDLDISCWLYL